jgi:hypothetical protein
VAVTGKVQTVHVTPCVHPTTEGRCRTLLYREGQVIVQRTKDYGAAAKAARKARRSRVPEPAGWTLHRATCSYLLRVRSKPLQPAPADLYDGTVACHACKPSLEKPAPPTTPDDLDVDGYLHRANEALVEQLGEVIDVDADLARLKEEVGDKDGGL